MVPCGEKDIEVVQNVEGVFEAAPEHSILSTQASGSSDWERIQACVGQFLGSGG